MRSSALIKRVTDLDLADQVQGRSQSGLAFFPFGRANFAWVSSNVLSSLDFAQQLGSVTANAAIVQFNDFDLAFRVDHEGATIRQTSFFDQYVEVARDSVGRVADHGVLDFADGWRSVVPGSVGEVSVGGNAVDLDAQFLECVVVVSQVFQLGWAYEGEVCWVEENDRPLAFQVSVRDFYEVAVFECVSFERFYLAVDDRLR